MSSRMLSNSEISTALECFAKWDFKYGGRLAGSTLKTKGVTTILSRGSAWGAGLAAYHAGGDIDVVRFHFRTSLMKDYLRAANVGLPIPEEILDAQQLELEQLFYHYRDVRPRLNNLTWLEEEMTVPLYGAKSNRSNKYQFLAKIDGFSINPTFLLDGEWIVEFKLRSALHEVSVLERSTQNKWYAWTYWMKTGRLPAGIIIDTWLATVPSLPRMVKAKRKGEGNAEGLVLSEAKDQVTRLDWYLAACKREGVQPKREVEDALMGRVWGQFAPIAYARHELVQAGEELVTARRVIHALDTGLYVPVRNAGPRVCSSCRFNKVCSNPGDASYVDTLFERGTPKRLLPPRERSASGT